MLDLEQIQSNWEKYQSLLQKLDDEGINNLLEELGQRICEAPAAIHRDQSFSYPGGLVSSMLKITSALIRHDQANNVSLTHGKRTLIKVGLLHDIGRVGNLDQPYYLEQDSDWHIEKLGKLYKINEDIDFMTPVERTFFILQHFGINLTKEEYQAFISLTDDRCRNHLGNLLRFCNCFHYYSEFVTILFFLSIIVNLLGFCNVSIIIIKILIYIKIFVWDQ